MTQLDRRTFLLTTAAAGAAGVSVVLDPVTFAPATTGDQTRTPTGTIPYGAPDWVYIPVEVPEGANRISVTYRHDRPTPPPGQAGNALDIGIFDQRGHELGDAAGFRGSIFLGRLRTHND